MAVNSSRNRENYKNSLCYKIETTYYFEDVYELLKHQKNIYSQFLRLTINNEKFNNISFIIGASNKSSKTAEVIYLKNGKRGRPKKIILGEEIHFHLHIYVYSENGKMMSSFCDEAKKKLEKKGYIAEKWTNDNLYNAINYVEKQSEHIRGNGIFSVSKKIGKIN